MEPAPSLPLPSSEQPNVEITKHYTNSNTSVSHKSINPVSNIQDASPSVLYSRRILVETVWDAWSIWKVATVSAVGWAFSNLQPSEAIVAVAALFLFALVKFQGREFKRVLQCH